MLGFKKRPSILLQSRTNKWLIILFAALVIAAPIIIQDNYMFRLCGLILCYGVLAMSIDLLSGYMGLSAFGNSGIYGFAAYTMAILLVRLDMPYPLAILLAIIGAAVLAAIFGLVSLKVWGNTFLIVNLALGQTIWGLSYRWNGVTGGEQGMPGIPRPSFFGIDFKNQLNFFILLSLVFAGCAFVAYRIVNSPFGLTVHGVRQSRKRMNALGYNVLLHKYLTYILSGTLAGVAGVMLVMLTGYISPTDITIVVASKAFLMSLLGGIGTMAGAILGAAIVVLMENLISGVTARWVMILGLMYILTVMCSPKGIIGLFRDLISKFKNRRSRAAAKDTAPDTVGSTEESANG